jgi:hypothetical protein
LPAIARQARAADRKAKIAQLKANGDPLAGQYERASARAETAMARARKSGEYPLLSRGDINIYSLFVERAQTLVKPSGIAGLLTPSGILSDKQSERFLLETIPAGRVLFGLDFFNKRTDGSLFFPDVYYRYKFCVFICARQRHGDGIGRYGFFARSISDVGLDQLIAIDERMIREISPTTFLVPVLRNERDFEIASMLATASDALRFEQTNLFRYRTPFHMAGDSSLFHTIEELNAKGAFVTAGGEWRLDTHRFERVFEGKMVQAYNHRAASVGFYQGNTFRTGSSEITSEELYHDPSFVAVSRFYVTDTDARWDSRSDWALGIKDVTSTTNTRSTIAALIPRCAAGHTLPVLFEREGSSTTQSVFACANLNAFAVDFFARQKIHNNHLTLNILNQIPLIAGRSLDRSTGSSGGREIILQSVLRLTYTANDMTAFARDMGYNGPPFRWDEGERRHLRARLDALYFHLYGITDEADIRYILSTFPIVERKDREAYDGVYLTAELIIWYFRALAAGDAASLAPQDAILRSARRAA